MNTYTTIGFAMGLHLLVRGCSLIIPILLILILTIAITALVLFRVFILILAALLPCALDVIFVVVPIVRDILDIGNGVFINDSGVGRRRRCSCVGISWEAACRSS